MPDNEKDFKINIETTASGDGAKKTEDALKKVNTELDQSKPKLSFYEEGMKKAEEGAASAAKSTDALAGAATGTGIVGVTAASAAAAAAVGVFAAAVQGLDKMAPSLSGSLGAIGGAIKGAFQEVMGGSLHRALSDLFGKDFEARLQKIAESFGGMTKQMKLMGSASADYIANQKSINDLLKEENQLLQEAATHRKNIADEAQRERDVDLDIATKDAEEEKARIDRDPNREFQPGDKLRDKDWIDWKNQRARDQAEDEALQQSRDQIDADERAAAEKVNSTDAAAKAAAGISRGDFRRASDLPADQRQKVTEAQGKIAQAVTPEDAIKARDALAALIKTFEDARRKALDEFEKEQEAARHKRALLDLEERKINDARDRRNYNEARTAPVREAEAEAADIQGEIAAHQAQLAALMKQNAPKELQATDEMIALQNYTQEAIARQTAIIKDLAQKLAQQKAQIEDLKSKADSL